MRGDTIFVRTVAGSRGRDEGSQCSHPLPFNSVRDFQIHQISGRNQIQLAQAPNRMNNYTALIAINDPQGGGDNYTFEVTWRADAEIATAPAAFFDDVRACQETVRQRFQSQNGRQGYLDFDNFARRSGQNQVGDPGERKGKDSRDEERRDGDRRDKERGDKERGDKERGDKERGDKERGDGDRRDADKRDADRRGNRGQETIQGRGTARTRNDSREISYSCIVDLRQNRVISGSYQFTGDGERRQSR